MTDLDILLREFEARFRADGGADPRPYLEQVEGEERERLREKIEAFLETAPLRPWDAGDYPGSIAARAVEGLEGALSGVSGSWPVVLPRLRHAAELKRSQVVGRLARDLGHPEQEEKIADYYHEMERGLLPADGVSTGVLEALGRIVGVSAAYLRRAGEQAMLGEGGAAGSGQVFARQVVLDDADAVARPEAAFGHESPDAREPDEVDRLFTSGD